MMNRVGKAMAITLTDITILNATIIAIDTIATTVMMITMNATVTNFTVGGGVDKRAVVHPTKTSHPT